MNKKLLTSIVTLGVIATSVANAAITKEQCVRSDKVIWVDNVANADGTKGACVPKNACKSSAFKNDFCNTDFSKLQVNSTEHAKRLIQDYAKLRLGWTDGCTTLIEISVNNPFGQDYIGCYSNGNYKTFEIDDTNESDTVLGANDFIKGMCIVLNGQFNIRNNGSMICNGISGQACTALSGTYSSDEVACDIGSYTLSPTEMSQKISLIVAMGILL